MIQLLNEKSLSFKELIEESKLSRTVVNNHLKDMLGKGLIKKIYESGKILNVLQPSKLDLVKWFLSQLEEAGVPKEVIDKGRNVLNVEVYFFQPSSTCEL